MAPRRHVLLLLSALFCTFVSPLLAAPDAAQIAADIAAGKGRDGEFNGAAAPGLSLRYCDLSGSKWQQSDLRGSSWESVNLAGSNFTGTNLRGAVLVNVNLSGANLSDVDLSGGLLRMVNLDGAVMAACRMTGATFDHPLLTAGGGVHLPALTAALRQVTGLPLTRAEVAACSGDAFTFVYNTQDAAFWPAQPFTINPLLAAPAALGLEAKLRADFIAEKVLLDEKAPGVHILPLVPTGEAQAVLGQRPVWVQLLGRQVNDKHTYFSVSAPLLGTLILRKDELLQAWAPECDVLEPVGGISAAKRPLLTITAAATGQATPEQTLKTVLRQAIAAISDKRVYGPLVPGEAGLLRLAQDLQAAAEANDWETARRLAAWQDFPRECLRSGRLMAVEYLAGVAQKTEPVTGTRLHELSGLYRLEVGTLDKWPALPAAAAAPADWQQSYRQAAALVADLAAIEHRVAQTMVAMVQ